MNVLDDVRVQAFRRDGYLYPFPLLDDAAREECLAGLARYERWLGSPVNDAAVRWRTMTYYLLPWMDRLARHPGILDVVEDLLGPDLLMWTGTFFIKEAHSPTYAAWHQDGTYFGLEPPEIATVWVALTDASREAGCLEVLPHPGGRPHQYRHETKALPHSINRAGQTIVEDVDESRAVAMPLPAGSFSIHGYHAVHRSAPNASDHRRVGVGLNYMPASARSTTGVRPAAMLVRGRDRHGHFELLPPPEAELDDDALATHERATTLYRENYAVQQARHAGTADAAEHWQLA